MPTSEPMSSVDYPRDRTVTLYNYDQNYVFTGANTKRVKAGSGYPASCTDISPPPLDANQAAVFNVDASEWSIVADYRGRMVYDTATGERSEISFVGELPEGTTLTPPPSANHQWDGSTWIANIDDAKNTAMADIRAHAKNTFHRIVGTLSALEVDRIRAVVDEYEAEQTIAPELQVHVDSGMTHQQALDHLKSELSGIDQVTQKVYLAKTRALYEISAAETLDDIETARTSAVVRLQGLIS